MIDTLSPWQARQASMLYHYSSLEYVKMLHRLVEDFVSRAVDPIQMFKGLQKGTAVLTCHPFDNDRSYEKWAVNCLPILDSLQTLLAGRVALRASDDFDSTYVGAILRSLDEYAMAFATKLENKRYEAAISVIFSMCTPN